MANLDEPILAYALKLYPRIPELSSKLDTYTGSAKPADFWYTISSMLFIDAFVNLSAVCKGAGVAK